MVLPREWMEQNLQWMEEINFAGCFPPDGATKGTSWAKSAAVDVLHDSATATGRRGWIPDTPRPSRYQRAPMTPARSEKPGVFRKRGRWGSDEVRGVGRWRIKSCMETMLCCLRLKLDEEAVCQIHQGWDSLRTTAGDAGPNAARPNAVPGWFDIST
jgi:hypothetical protein